MWLWLLINVSYNAFSFQDFLCLEKMNRNFNTSQRIHGDSFSMHSHEEYNYGERGRPPVRGQRGKFNSRGGQRGNSTFCGGPRGNSTSRGGQRGNTTFRGGQRGKPNSELGQRENSFHGGERRPSFHGGVHQNHIRGRGGGGWSSNYSDQLPTIWNTEFATEQQGEEFVLGDKPDFQIVESLPAVYNFSWNVFKESSHSDCLLNSDYFENSLDSNNASLLPQIDELVHESANNSNSLLCRDMQCKIQEMISANVEGRASDDRNSSYSDVSELLSTKANELSLLTKSSNIAQTTENARQHKLFMLALMGSAMCSTSTYKVSFTIKNTQT